MFSTSLDDIQAPGHDVWFSTTVTIDPGEDAAYAALLAGLGKTVGDEEIQLRFGYWYTGKDAIGGNVLVDWECYTDNWSLSSAVPEPATIALLGLGALALIRKKR